jgi:hypothetical protein
MKPTQTAIAAACITLLFATAPAHAAGPGFTPGLWETTTTMELQGAPAGMPGMGPQTHRECVTAKDVDHIPQKVEKNCTVNQKQKNANTMTWTVACNHGGMTSSGKGEATTQGDTSHGFFEMTMDGGPHGPMVMKTSFKSKRVGACK